MIRIYMYVYMNMCVCVYIYIKLNHFAVYQKHCKSTIFQFKNNFS